MNKTQRKEIKSLMNFGYGYDVRLDERGELKRKNEHVLHGEICEFSI